MAKRNWKIVTLTLVLMLAMVCSGCKSKKVEHSEVPKTEPTQTETEAVLPDATAETQAKPKDGLTVTDADGKDTQAGEAGLDWEVSGGGEDLSFEESEKTTTKPTDPAPTTKPTDPAPTTKPTDPAPTTKPTDPAPTTKPTEPAPTTKPTEPAPATEPTKPTESIPVTEPTQATEPSTEPTQPGGSTDSTEWGPLI